jgi:hypothetical protein
MRKLTLLTVILLTVCLAGAFAELTGVGAPTASGSVSVIIGYDLDNEGFGIVNDSSITVTMPLLDGSAGAGGMDDMYGEITIDAIGWSLDTGSALYDADEDSDGYGDLDASITASLHINPLVITLGKPDFAINYVDVSDSYNVDANGDVTGDTGGLSIGYVSDMVTVTAMIATKGDYRDAGDVDATEADTDHAAPFTNDLTPDGATSAGDEVYTNDANDMAFGVSFSLAPADGITIDGTFMYDAATDSKSSTAVNVAATTIATAEDLMAVGLKAVVAMDPLTLTIPVDFVQFGDASGFEVNPVVGFTIMEGLTLDANFLFGSYTEVAAAPNAVVGAGLTLTDAASLVDGLTNTVAFALVDMSDYEDVDADMQWDLDVDIEYAMGGLTPYFNFGLDEASSFDFGVGAILGADFTGIDNTAITVDYTNGGGDPAESGRVTLDVTVSF